MENARTVRARRGAPRTLRRRLSLSLSLCVCVCACVCVCVCDRGMAAPQLTLATPHPPAPTPWGPHCPESERMGMHYEGKSGTQVNGNPLRLWGKTHVHVTRSYSLARYDQKRSPHRLAPKVFSEKSIVHGYKLVINTKKHGRGGGGDVHGRKYVWKADGGIALNKRVKRLHPPRRHCATQELR